MIKKISLLLISLIIYSNSFAAQFNSIQDNLELTCHFNESSGSPVATVNGYVTGTNTGSMIANRAIHTATLLPDGNVLVAGGQVATVLSSCELYISSAGVFASTTSLNIARSAHNSVLLSNNKVLIIGGTFDGTAQLSSCELYDYTDGSMVFASSMTTARSGFFTSKLQNGDILVCGGWNAAGSQIASAEVYVSSANIWKTVGDMNTARGAECADGILLSNGKVLIVGGYVAGTTYVSTAELYDPTTETFSYTGSLTYGRYCNTATLLPNGNVLISGNTSFSELYNPINGTFSVTGFIPVPVFMHTATLLPNGKVLNTGGVSGSTYYTATNLYDVPLGLYFPSIALPGNTKRSHRATLLSNGWVLISGGYAGGTTFRRTCDLYKCNYYSVGTITGSNSAWVSGQFGNCFYTTGSSNYVSGFRYNHIADNILINCWRKISTGGTVSNMSRFYNPNASLYKGWVIQLSVDAEKIRISGIIGNNTTSYRDISSDYIYNLDTWYLVSMWYSSSVGVQKIFVNGEPVPIANDNGVSLTTIGTNNSETLAFGMFQSNGTLQYSSGAFFDDTAIHSNITTLTQAQAIIKQLYTQGRGQND